jgi:hypothetical protein
VANSAIYPVLASSLCFLNACGGGGGTSPPPPPVAAPTHFSVAVPANIPTGTFFTFTVTALDASNNRVPNYTGTVHFTSSDPRAQLAQDSRVASGSQAFSATLIAAGNQTITASDKTTSSITGSSSPIGVGAVAGAYPVEWFGAKGDGIADDTSAIQNAINAAGAAGGGSVVFKVARYFTTGAFIVPNGVILCGTIEGPFDVAGVNPALTAIAPTLLVTNKSAPFLTLQGMSAGVADLIFHYPDQVKTSAAAPIPYPYTIMVTAPAGAKVVRSTATNAYNFLDIDHVQEVPSQGRIMVQDLYIGAFNIGINIDHTFDFTILQNLHNGVFWDEVEGAIYPSPLDTWVLNNGTALVVNRMDALEVHNFFVFSRATGVLLTDSPDTTLPARHGWGRVSDIELRSVQYGVIATSTEGFGFEFSNLQVAAAPGLGQAAVQLRAGGTTPPWVVVNGGSVQGTWALGAFPIPQAGRLTHVNVIGSDLL